MKYYCLTTLASDSACAFRDSVSVTINLVTSSINFLGLLSGHCLMFFIISNKNYYCQEQDGTALPDAYVSQ